MDEPGQPGTGLEAYARRAREVQEVLLTEEREHLLQAARLLADSLVFEDERDRVIHVFGAGHSHLLAEEMFWRAGGLVPIHPILDPNLTPLGGPRSGPLERLEGYARILLSGEELRPGEAMVVFSNSGINAAPVEMALSARELGLRVVAVTSRAHADQMPSRHSSSRTSWPTSRSTHTCPPATPRWTCRTWLGNRRRATVQVPSPRWQARW
jgi:uncharacterized phosphosugar-binding protein